MHILVCLRDFDFEVSERTSKSSWTAWTVQDRDSSAVVALLSVQDRDSSAVVVLLSVQDRDSSAVVALLSVQDRPVQAALDRMTVTERGWRPRSAKRRRSESEARLHGGPVRRTGGRRFDHGECRNAALSCGVGVSLLCRLAGRVETARRAGVPGSR